MKPKRSILAALLLGMMVSGYWFGLHKSDTVGGDASGSTKALSSGPTIGGDEKNGIRARRTRAADLGAYKRVLMDPEAIAAMDYDARLRLLEEIGRLGNASEREKGWAALLHIIASLDPDQAIALARKLPPGGHNEVAKWVGMPLMHTQPAKAAAFMIEMADPKDLGSTYTDIASNWVDRDAKAAGEWLNTLPQGPDLDRASRAYAIKAADQDPAVAMAWAASIGNEFLRAESLLVVYQTWKTEDPAGAAAALKALGLTMEQLNADLKMPRPKLTNGDDDD
ncbi:MAG: hypothetical protein J0M04_20145 [Verrucomicrobia bacterium]|nr:hypothetical protein [Verrucomicrobiota bacterium]